MKVMATKVTFLEGTPPINNTLNNNLRVFENVTNVEVVETMSATLYKITSDDLDDDISLNANEYQILVFGGVIKNE